MLILRSSHVPGIPGEESQTHDHGIALQTQVEKRLNEVKPGNQSQQLARQRA